MEKLKLSPLQRKRRAKARSERSHVMVADQRIPIRKIRAVFECWRVGLLPLLEYGTERSPSSYYVSIRCGHFWERRIPVSLEEAMRIADEIGDWIE